MSSEFATGTAVGTDSHAVAVAATRDAYTGIGDDGADFCQVFCSPQYELSGVVEGIRDVIGDGVELIGCTSAGEFTESGTTDGSVTLALVSSDAHEFYTGFGTGLKEDVNACLSSAVAELPSQVEGYPHLSAINLHDGLAGVGEQVAIATQRTLGQHVSFAGGSAGDDLQLDSTHVICNDRISQDAVVIALVASKEPIPITVDHGHEPISDSLEVTHAEDNIVYELDDEPAFEVWQRAIRDHAREHYGVDPLMLTADSDEFERLLNAYEFGIDRGSDYKIRWPGLTETADGPLQFTLNMPEGTVLRVMHGSPEKQVESVVSAAREAKRASGNSEIAGGFIYDCICRSAILGEEFGDSVAAATDELDVPLIGFETYGELCMQRGQIGGYHNTTSVVFLLPE